MKLKFTIILIFLYCELFSQNPIPTQFPRINIKAPDVSDFIKQGDIPINQYMGNINLSLPVIKNNLVDINLNYDSSGFKPMKRPSSIGLNWALNTGGNVTREVVGYPDEYIGYPHVNGSDLPYNGFIVGVRNKTHNYTEVYNHIGTTGHLLLSGEWQLKGTDNTKSYEGSPDIFKFSVNGLSGKFFMGNDGIVKVVTDQPGKIEVLLDEFPNQQALDCTPEASKIKIIDAEGNIYHFGGITSNLGYTVATTEPFKPIINTWYLSKIIYANGSELNYTYMNDSSLTDSFCSISAQGYKFFLHNPVFKKFISLHEYFNKQISLQQSYGSFSGTGFISSSTNNIYSYEIEKKAILEKIEYDDFKILFSYSYQSSNFNIPYEIPMANYNYFDIKLDNIKYYTNSNSLVKIINFNYDYFGNTNKRLFLISYGEQGLPTYNFEYNITTTENLPIPVTKGVDHWGYWNGAPVENPLVPSMNYLLNGDFEYTTDTRLANFIYANKGQLTKIIYPTKGYSVFEFEEHKYSNRLEIRSTHGFIPQLYSVNGIAGGTRIKSIKDYNFTDNLVPISTKEFKYVKNYTITSNSELSSGVLLFWPRYVSYWEELLSNGALWYKYGYIRSNNIGKNTFDTNTITYSEVTEIQNNNGYIIYKFSDYESNPDLNHTNFTSLNEKILSPEDVAKNYNGYFLNSTEVERGKLIHVKIFDNTGVLKEETKNAYNASDTRFDTFTTSIHTTAKWSQSNKLYYYPYFLTKKEVTKYNLVGNNSFREEYLYTYNANNLPNLESKLNSDGSSIEKETYYPDDVINVNSLNGDPLTSQDYAEISKLKTTNKHHISTPIQIETYIKNPNGSRELLNKQRNLFYETNGLVMPFISQNAKGVGALEDKIKFDKYDLRGNIVQYTQENGVPVTIIWGYNNSLPIAKLENVLHTSISSTIINDLITKSNADNDHCLLPTCKEEVLRGALNSLRTTFPNAMVTTYTHNPLVGVTSITDPKGNRIIYHYDSLNRLEFVKDKDGNILGENAYHYKN